MSTAADWSWMTPGGYDQALNNATPDESACLRQAAGVLGGAQPALERGRQWARSWVEALRKTSPPLLSLERMLQDYPLTSPEGLALLRLAEALIRTPDEATRGLLLADKLAQGQWDTLNQEHSGLRAWKDAALAWAARIENNAQTSVPASWWTQWMARGVDRSAAWMLRQIGEQFVAGVTVSDTHNLQASLMSSNDCLSFDSLGESAQTLGDVDHFMSLYESTARSLPAGGPHSLSIKLSALHPQLDELHRDSVMKQLPDRVAHLARIAARQGVALTLDAEESDRLMLTLDVAHAVHGQLARDSDETVRQWQGLGLAVQAYQKRALKVIELLIQHAGDSGRRWQIRLVKGAYWDTEIMRAQQAGLKSYPVLTSRAATDMNFLACAWLLMRNRKQVYPMLGTHNALTLASVIAMGVRDLQQPVDTAENPWNFECQRLYGMGEQLWKHVRQMPALRELPCRIYTPVGTDSAALSYLIRRLLENGANSSFIHQIHNPDIRTSTLLQDPIQVCTQRMFSPSEQLPDPPLLFANRRNAAGYHLASRDVQRWVRSALHSGAALCADYRQRYEKMCGNADAESVSIDERMRQSGGTGLQWATLAVHERARLLNAWADRIEIHADQALTLLVHESHKTVRDALNEIREAVDFLRYYSHLAQQMMAHPMSLKGPAGEVNQLQLKARGVWLCISPWNFPLAILTGQTAAALACGNPVLTKAAEQSTAIAAWVIERGHDAGIPAEVLQCIPAARDAVRPWLEHAALRGVSFTGSNATARQLRIKLAGRIGEQIPLIAETGGMNAMIVDSTALLEQAVDHITESAFNMAGQRCSALRVLYVQADMADVLLQRLCERVALFSVKAPDPLDCDVPPLIDEAASQRLQAQWHTLKDAGETLMEPKFWSLPCDGKTLHLCSPGIVRMREPQTQSEVFGPLLQVCTYEASAFDRVLNQINSWGWGLTLGLQSRIDSRIAKAQSVAVGTLYVNRPMIGAVVGVQPFGGRGLSGTGPKAGGPDSLRPYCTEHLTSINTAAAGGVADLLAMPQDPVKLANRFDASA